MFRTIHWRFILAKSWKAVVMGVLIAIGITLFPQARCALAGECNAASDLWCNWGQPGQCCDPSHGFKVVYGCRQQAGYCAELVDTVPVRCSPQSGNCWVTEVLPSQKLRADFSDRLRWSGNTKYWYVGACSQSNCGPVDTKARPFRATCCSGQQSCTPSYAPPTIDDEYTVYPPYPIVWTQGSHGSSGIVSIPESPKLPSKNAMSLIGRALGITINDIKAHGGADTACGSGRASITSITVAISLRQASIDWILGELAQRYPGAYVKGTYPQPPETSGYLAPGEYAFCAGTDGLTGKNTPDAELDCRFFTPWDPGQYDVIVTACQTDGKCTTKTLPQPITVWLLETKLGR